MLITMVQIPASYLIPSPRYSGMPSLIPRPSSRLLHRQPSPFHPLTPPLPPITVSPTHPLLSHPSPSHHALTPSSPTHHRLTMHSPPPLPPITVSPCTHPLLSHPSPMHSPLLSHPSPSHPLTPSSPTHHRLTMHSPSRPKVSRQMAHSARRLIERELPEAAVEVTETQETQATAYGNSSGIM